MMKTVPFFKKSLEKNLIEFILQKKTQKNHSGNFTKKQNKMLCGNFTKKLLKNILMFLGNLMAFFILLRIILEEKILMQIPPSSLEYYDFIKSLILASFLGSFSANFFIYFFLDDNMRQFDEKNAETNTREKYWRDNERVCVLEEKKTTSMINIYYRKNLKKEDISWVQEYFYYSKEREEKKRNKKRILNFFLYTTRQNSFRKTFCKRYKMLDVLCFY